MARALQSRGRIGKLEIGSRAASKGTKHQSRVRRRTFASSAGHSTILAANKQILLVESQKEQAFHFIVYVN